MAAFWAPRHNRMRQLGSNTALMSRPYVRLQAHEAMMAFKAAIPYALARASRTIRAASSTAARVALTDAFPCPAMS